MFCIVFFVCFFFLREPGSNQGSHIAFNCRVSLVLNLSDCLVSVWIFHNNDLFEGFRTVVLKNVPQFGFVCLFFMTGFRANMFDYDIGDGVSFSVQNLRGDMLRC